MNSKSFSIGLLGMLIGGIISFYLFSTADNQTRIEGWTAVYKHSREGKPLHGTKQDLLTAIRNGYDIRIGWGWEDEASGKSMEHLADPIWIAVLSEEEVMAHLDPQVLSHINWDNLSADYEDSTLMDQEWRVVLSTKGEFDAVWYNRATNQITRRVPQKHIMTWFVDYPRDQQPSLTKLSSEAPLE